MDRALLGPCPSGAYPSRLSGLNLAHGGIPMDKADRLQATLRGEPVDRVAVALWRHFPVDDQSPDMLAAATVEWQTQYDFDLIKVTPASSFCLKDWGAQDRWTGNPEGTREYTQRVIQRPGDWNNLK